MLIREQQRAADEFFRHGLLPRPVAVRDAVELLEPEGE